MPGTSRVSLTPLRLARAFTLSVRSRWGRLRFCPYLELTWHDLGKNSVKF